MPALTNPKHERFAIGLAKRKPASEAYEQAGYAPSRSAASRLSTNVNIQRRVAELQRKAAGRAAVTIQTLADQLDEDREFARVNKQANAAINATMNKAKLLGLYSERREVSGPGGAPIQTVDLTKLSDDELSRLEAIIGPLAFDGGDPSGEGEAGEAG